MAFPFLSAAGSSLSTSGSLDTEGSYDEDRPLSVRVIISCLIILKDFISTRLQFQRLTIIESPSSEFDQECEEAELSRFSLESPDPSVSIMLMSSVLKSVFFLCVSDAIIPQNLFPINRAV